MDFSVALWWITFVCCTLRPSLSLCLCMSMISLLLLVVGHFLRRSRHPYAAIWSDRLGVAYIFTPYRQMIFFLGKANMHENSWKSSIRRVASQYQPHKMGMKLEPLLNELTLMGHCTNISSSISLWPDLFVICNQYSKSSYGTPKGSSLEGSQRHLMLCWTYPSLGYFFWTCSSALPSWQL